MLRIRMRGEAGIIKLVKENIKGIFIKRSKINSCLFKPDTAIKHTPLKYSAFAFAYTSKALCLCSILAY